MSTSPTTTLSKPIAGERVPPETFAYFRARAKRFAYDLVIKELRRSKITKAELACRLGADPARVSRMLGGPGNWTIGTLSDLLFAISGTVPTYGIDDPLARPRRNFSGAQAAISLSKQNQLVAPAPEGSRLSNLSQSPGVPVLGMPKITSLRAA
jgi:hypothetical protein